MRALDIWPLPISKDFDSFFTQPLLQTLTTKYKNERCQKELIQSQPLFRADLMKTRLAVISFPDCTLVQDWVISEFVTTVDGWVRGCPQMMSSPNQGVGGGGVGSAKNWFCMTGGGGPGRKRSCLKIWVSPFFFKELSWAFEVIFNPKYCNFGTHFTQKVLIL